MKKVTLWIFLLTLLLIAAACQKDNLDKINKHDAENKEALLKNFVYESPNPTLTTFSDLKEQAESRGSSAESILCGQTLFGRYNNNGNNNTGCGRYGSAYDGQDSEFWLYIGENDTEVTITLTGHTTTKDLDLFIKNNGSSNCIYDSDPNGPSSNEKIEVELNKGWYSIFVDGWYRDQASFDISVICKSCDNFESYSSNAKIANRSTDWERYSDFSGDGQITSSRRASGQKSLFVSNDSGANAKIYNNFGRRISGRYRVTYDLYVPNGNNAYMGFTKNSDSSNPEQGVMISFREARKLAFFRRGKNLNHPDFNYSQNRWMSVEIVVDIENGDKDLSWATLIIDGYSLASWKVSLTSNFEGLYANSIGGMYFQTVHSNSDFYIDNFCFEELPTETNISIIRYEAYTFITID